MPIRIEIEANSAWEAREEMRQLLADSGFSMADPARPNQTVPADTEARVASVVSEMTNDAPDETFQHKEVAGTPVNIPPEHEAAYTPGERQAKAEIPEQKPASEPQGRLYGQPSPGKARRNKAEMAEDEEIDALRAELGIDMPEGVATEILERFRGHKAREAAQTEDEAPSNISTTPEDRKEPADETPEATREDVKAAMTKYVEKHGMDKAMTDLPKVMGYERQSEIPDDAAIFTKVVAAIEEAL